MARESYGRLVAYLSVHTHDLASAEDALSEGLVAALKTWPRDGVPQNPEIESEGVIISRTGQCGLTFCSVSVKPARPQTFMTERSAWPRILP